MALWVWVKKNQNGDAIISILGISFLFPIFLSGRLCAWICLSVRSSLFLFFFQPKKTEDKKNDVKKKEEPKKEEEKKKTEEVKKDDKKKDEPKVDKKKEETKAKDEKKPEESKKDDKKMDAKDAWVKQNVFTTFCDQNRVTAEKWNSPWTCLNPK